MEEMAAARDELRLGEDQRVFFNSKHKPVAIPAPPYPVIDTHAHLTMMGGEGKVLSEESVLPGADAFARAFLSGVTRVICIADCTEDGADPKAFLEWIDRVEETALAEVEEASEAGLAGLFPLDGFGIYVSAGVHPYGAAEVDDAMLGRIRTILRSERAVAMGEMGLDYHCDLDPAIQRAAFVRQLELAKEIGLPLELHVRDATDDPDYLAHEEALGIVTEADVASLGIDLHCYTLGPEPMKGWLDLGAKVAFGGALTFKRSVEIREAAALCPRDRILSETDSPYMAPEPLRGTRCEPAMTLASAWRIAEARGEVDEAADVTFRALWDNASQLFHLED